MTSLLHNWWRALCRLVLTRKHYRHSRRVASLGEFTELRPDEVLLVAGEREPKWALLKCPCGCGEVAHVNLMKSHNPHWTIREEIDGTVTFWPSLWIDHSRCGSHFFVWHGRVIWCTDLS
jgi:hypothetical protein